MSVVDVLRAARRLSALSGTDSRRTSGAGADPIWAGGGVGAGRGAGMSTAAPRTRGICREIRCVRRGLRNASLPTGREGVAKGAAMLTCRSDFCARRVRVACSTKPSRMRRPFLPRMSLSNAPRRTPRRSITFCAWLRRANSFRRMAAPGSQVAELLGGERSSPARTTTGAPALGGGCPRYRSSVRRNCSTAAAGTANFMLRGGHAPRGHDGLDRIRRESGGGGF